MVICRGAEAFPEVDGEGRRYGVDVCRDGTHGGGKDGSNQQSCQSLRQLTHHEEGEDGITLGHREVEFGGMGLEEGVESCADNIENHADKDTHQSVHPDALLGTLDVLCREVALYDGLVRGVGYEIVGQSTTEYGHPEGDTTVIPAPLEEAQFVIVHSQLPGS